MTTNPTQAQRDIVWRIRNDFYMDNSQAANLIANHVAEEVAKALTDTNVAQWKPINTAPKDGTLILGYDHGQYVPMSFHENPDVQWWSVEEEHGFVCHTPTHWKPLTPPTEQEG